MAKPKVTPETLGNQFGYRCPECARGDYLHVAATVGVALYAHGTEMDSCDTEWGDESGAWCGYCEWSGNVRDLKVDPNFEES